MLQLVKRFLPDAPSHQPDGAFEGNDDYSHVPSWKKWTAAIVLIFDSCCYDL